MFSYNALHGEGIMSCEASAILDSECEKQFYSVFVIISRNGALTQQPGIGHRRLH